jgi:hypothetical protein
MIVKSMRRLIVLFLLHCFLLTSKAADFTIVSSGVSASIVYNKKAPAIDSIAAHLLAEDIQRVTGVLPQVVTDITKAKGNVIVIGKVQSPLIHSFVSTSSPIANQLKNKWECYGLMAINKPIANINQALIIAGSDDRGTAYGVFDISRKIGVSPWYWWADVTPIHHQELSIKVNEYVSSSPSVKYRGIFLNDEDWGLQPWAAKTFEPKTGDIGPKTYAKIFELLLRLKANLIWPAMHPSTKAFYHYPGNIKVAEQYSIIIGSSHAEPMLRNNVSEWNEKVMGNFNYITNKPNVYKYWEDRVKESKNLDAIYTLGMRGVHDSGIEGVKTSKEAVPLIEQIFEDQRQMLTKHLQKPVTAIPQVFTVYKEVLEIYDLGLKVPQDVTIVWPDDNYGYIQRLNDEGEKKRQGGAGVYYHASYWGRPHDYLWLSTTHPALIREELMKAYETNADRLWVLNVGDIKPLEYNIQLFTDMAYNAKPFKDSRYVNTHMLNWANEVFGKKNGSDIQNILWQYYQFAFERRPEFMGWSQTEPTTETNYTQYNHFYYGDQAQQRIDKYEALEKQVKALRRQIDPVKADAFYELIYYPVVGASLMNKKFLYRDKSYLYAKQNRLSAYEYNQLSRQVYDSIIKETDFYNSNLANGKWKNIMSMKPRDLTVYHAPVLAEIKIDTSIVWNVIPEGSADTSAESSNNSRLMLPFNRSDCRKYFVDLFLSANKQVKWTVSTSADWIKLSATRGMLTTEAGKKQQRVWVAIDWTKAPKADSLKGTITFKGGDKTIPVAVKALNNTNELKDYKGFIESNQYVSIHAANYSRQVNTAKAKWEIIDGLGNAGKSIEALRLQIKAFDTTQLVKTSPCLEYDFYTFTNAPAEVAVYSLPTFPINRNYSMRYAVAVDDAPAKIIDFKTVGRTEEWKQNVLRNNTIKKVPIKSLAKGKHVLKIYMIDPGVILDRITIDLGGLQKGYGTIPETKGFNID